MSLDQTRGYILGRIPVQGGLRMNVAGCAGSLRTCIINLSLPRTGNRHLGSFPAAVLLCRVLEPPGMAFHCPSPHHSTWKHRSSRISSVLILSPDWQQTLSKVLSQEPELMFTLLSGAISTQALARLLGLKSDHGIQWFWHGGFQRKVSLVNQVLL